MKDLSAVEHKLINDLALQQTPKVLIAEKIGCHVATVYNSLHRSFPADASSQITTRRRKKEFYNAKEQVLATIHEYVLNHPWATNLDLIRGCSLKTTSKATVSRWLKRMGIGSYIACRQQSITTINANKRLVKILIFLN